MVSSNDLKAGMTILYKDTIHEVVECQHIKPGKGHAFVKTRLKNMTNGTIFEYSYRAKESIDQAIVEKKDLQYLYKDKDLYYFMDPETYEQIPVNKSQIEPLLEYLKEQQTIYFTLYQGHAVSVELPDFINLKVVQALPGIKGDTAQGGTKPVTLETGKVVQAPLFINQGDVIKVDTRTGRYIERVSQK